MKHFRHVSNLPLISMSLENVVLIQLGFFSFSFLSGNNLREIFQSAYKQNHTTEIAVLSVLDSLLGSAKKRLVYLVALLDLSTVFDTLDHSIVLKRLETTYGVRDTVLDWFVSYLSDRSQSVIFDGVVSASRTFVYGVPQGSVLGPVLFTFYFQLLSDVISDHICDYHKYTDDTELSKVHHLITSFMFSPVFRRVLMMVCSG